jgi:hypothetical protein
MKTNKTLQIHYYGLYVLLIALLAAAHFSFGGQPLCLLPNSTTMMVSTTNILVLLCIPLMFKLFAKRVERLTSMQQYVKWSLVQMYMVSFPALTSIITYLLLRESTPLYCYLIAFVALIFCKPTQQKWDYYQENINKSQS